MIHFNRKEFVYNENRDFFKKKKEFQRNSCVKFSSLISSDLLKLIQDQIKETDFFLRTHYTQKNKKKISTELYLRNGIPSLILHSLVNNPRFISVIREITDCQDIENFKGRIYRFCPGKAHFDSWHTDADGLRMVGLSINLSDSIYEGGYLQIRQKKSKKIIYQIQNVGFGDAIFFRIAPFLEHQVTLLKGCRPRTVFAGWFSKSE